MNKIKSAFESMMSATMDEASFFSSVSGLEGGRLDDIEFDFEYKIHSTSFLERYDQEADIFFTDATHYLKAVTVLPISEDEVHKKFATLDSDEESVESINLVDADIPAYKTGQIPNREYEPDDSLDYLAQFGIKKLDYIKLKVGYSYSKTLLLKFYHHRLEKDDGETTQIDHFTNSQEDPLVLRMIKQRFISAKELERYTEKYGTTVFKKDNLPVTKFLGVPATEAAFKGNFTSKRVRKTGQFHFGNILGSIIPDFEKGGLSFENAKNLKEISVIELQLPENLKITWPDQENMMQQNELGIEAFENNLLNKEIFSKFTTMDVYDMCEDDDDEDSIPEKRVILTTEEKQKITDEKRREMFAKNMKRYKLKYRKHELTQEWSHQLLDWVKKETERINRVYMCDFNRNARKLIPRIIGKLGGRLEQDVTSSDSGVCWTEAIFPDAKFKRLTKDLLPRHLQLMADTLAQGTGISTPEAIYRDIEHSVDPYLAIRDDSEDVNRGKEQEAASEVQQMSTSSVRVVNNLPELAQGWTSESKITTYETDHITVYNEASNKGVRWTRSQEKFLYNEKEECPGHSNVSEMTIDEKLARLSHKCMTSSDCCLSNVKRKPKAFSDQPAKGKDIIRIENRLKKYSKMLSVLFKKNQDKVLQEFVLKTNRNYDSLANKEILLGFKKDRSAPSLEGIHSMIKVDNIEKSMEIREKGNIQIDSDEEPIQRFRSSDGKGGMVNDYDFGSELSEPQLDFENHEQVANYCKGVHLEASEKKAQRLCRYRVKKTKKKEPPMEEEEEQEQEPVSRDFYMKRILEKDKRGKLFAKKPIHHIGKLNPVNEPDFDYEVSKFLKYDILEEESSTEPPPQTEIFFCDQQESFQTVDPIDCRENADFNDEPASTEQFLDSDLCLKWCKGPGKDEYYGGLCFDIKDLPSSLDVEVSSAVLYKTMVDKKVSLEAERLTCVSLLHLYVKLQREVWKIDKVGTEIFLREKLKDYGFLYEQFSKHICTLKEFHDVGKAENKNWLTKRVQDLELACPLLRVKTMRIPALYNSIIRFPFIRHIFLGRMFQESDFEIKHLINNFFDHDPNKCQHKCVNEKINSSCIYPMIDHMISLYGSLKKFLKFCMDAVVLHYLDTQRYYTLKDLFEKDAECLPLNGDPECFRQKSFHGMSEQTEQTHESSNKEGYISLIRNFCMASGQFEDFKNHFSSDFSIDVIREMTVQQMAEVFIDNDLKKWPRLNTNLVTNVIEAVQKVLSASVDNFKNTGKGTWVIPRDLDLSLLNGVVTYFNRYLRNKSLRAATAPASPDLGPIRAIRGHEEMGVVERNPKLPSLEPKDQDMLNRLITRVLLFKLLNDS